MTVALSIFSQTRSLIIYNNILSLLPASSIYLIQQKLKFHGWSPLWQDTVWLSKYKETLPAHTCFQIPHFKKGSKLLTVSTVLFSNGVHS